MLKKIDKKLFVLIFIIFATKSFAVYTYSLTNTYLITPVINPIVASEMAKIISDYSEIENLFKNEINLQLEDKNNYNKIILKEKAIGNTLLIEIKNLNNDIQDLIYLKGKIK